MFAVIRTGGKQYKVAEGDVIAVEKLTGDPGATVALDEVLMVGEGADATAGAPLVAGASVSAELVEHRRADKIIIFKKKRRHNYRRKNGHRQHQTYGARIHRSDELRRRRVPTLTSRKLEGSALPPPFWQLAIASSTATIRPGD